MPFAPSLIVALCGACNVITDRCPGLFDARSTRFLRCLLVVDLMLIEMKSGLSFISSGSKFGRVVVLPDQK